MKRIVMLAALSLAALLVLAAPALAQDPWWSNLLQNATFESETYHHVSTDRLDPNLHFNVPNFWGGGVVLGSGSPSWENVHPTGYPHTGHIKLSGDRSYHMARGGGTFTAYIYQQVHVAPGTTVEGGASAYIEATNGLVRAGIDPTGGTNPFSGNVVWSEWSGAANTWNRPGVKVDNVGATVTLFLYATQTAPSDPNGVYWDNAFLFGAAGAGPAAEAAPGVPAPAAPGERFATPTVRLNVRSGPGIDFDRITVITPADAFPITGEAEGWYQLNLNGVEGWVSGRFVNVSEGQPAAPAVAPADSLDFTVDYTLRLRAGPSTDTETLATIPYTAIVQAFGRTADNTWVQVNYAGQNGWVAARFGRLDGDINRLPVRN
jgi:uncharacterized protein YraI